MNRFVAVLGLVGLVGPVGCAKSPAPLVAPGEAGAETPGDWQPAPDAPNAPAPNAPAPNAAAAPAPMPFADALEALRATAERVRSGESMDNAALADALEAVADALYGLPDVAERETLRGNIRGYADRVRGADPTHAEPAGWAKSALGDAAAAMRSVGETRRIDAYSDRITAVYATIETISADRAPAEQREAVADALGRLAEAMAPLAPTGRGTD